MIKILLNLLTFIGKISFFKISIMRESLNPPTYYAEIINQIYLLSLRCLLPVCSVVTAFGMVVAIQGLNILRIFGAEYMVSGLLSVSLVRELCPCITCIMVAAQAGSGITAEIGAMRIKEEIDALTVISVNPIKFLIWPRLAALTISTLLINWTAQACGIAGGYIVTVLFKGVSKGVFFENMYTFTGMDDILAGSIKALIYGFIIGLFSTYYGYFVKGGASGVGAAVNSSVVNSILFFIFLNYILSSIFFATL